ncbi:hypothetical protein LR69_04439 [Geobacillus sp. BCO2]|nr:hypothetical protein LR69_04439 [Geobacillus sp. BCO2]
MYRAYEGLKREIYKTYLDPRIVFIVPTRDENGGIDMYVTITFQNDAPWGFRLITTISYKRRFTATLVLNLLIFSIIKGIL